jgi:hypothetical protein
MNKMIIEDLRPQREVLRTSPRATPARLARPISLHLLVQSPSHAQRSLIPGRSKSKTCWKCASLLCRHQSRFPDVVTLSERGFSSSHPSDASTILTVTCLLRLQRYCHGDWSYPTAFRHTLRDATHPDRKCRGRRPIKGDITTILGLTAVRTRDTTTASQVLL